MFLQRDPIIELIHEKELKIVPFELDLLEEVSYPIHLGKVIRVPIRNQKPVDVAAKEELEFDNVEISPEGWVWKSGSFLLGTSVEEFGFGATTMGMLDGSTRLAKAGMMIHLSSCICDPGRSNTMTLEMFNVGPTDILLKAGMKVADMYFVKVE